MIAHHTRPDAFDIDACTRIVVLARAAPARDGRLAGRQRDHGLRRADLVWIDEVEGAEGIMDRIIDILRTANRKVFGFDLTDFGESPQVAR